MDDTIEPKTAKALKIAGVATLLFSIFYLVILAESAIEHSTHGSGFLPLIYTVPYIIMFVIVQSHLDLFATLALYYFAIKGKNATTITWLLIFQAACLLYANYYKFQYFIEHYYRGRGQPTKGAALIFKSADSESFLVYCFKLPWVANKLWKEDGDLSVALRPALCSHFLISVILLLSYAIIVWLKRKKQKAIEQEFWQERYKD